MDQGQLEVTVATNEAIETPGKDTFTELSHPFQETLSQLCSNTSIPYCIFENCIFPTLKDPLEGQHSAPTDKDTLWSASSQHQKARMPWGKERISCAWECWEDSWGKLGEQNENACGEDLKAKSLSKAKVERAKGWGHYLLDKTSHPPGWARRETNV